MTPADNPAPGHYPSPPGYYGVPVIHRPHWKWLIVGYFFAGGISGASYAVAAIADLVGPDEDRPLVRAGRYLSLAALLPCPPLLVLDLGRPERFHHMLRAFNPRSPMSLGTWGFTIFGPVAALAATAQAAEDGLLGRGRLARLPSRIPPTAISAIGLPFGLFVAGYTGVLLAATAVPLWTKRALLLGPVFLSSAFSTATSALALLLALDRNTPTGALARLDRLERTALLAELALLAAWVARLGPTARPLTEGPTGAAFRHGTIAAGLTLPLLLGALKSILPSRAARPLTVAASLLTLTGGFLFRYAVVAGGQASADDPQATFDMTVTNKKPPSPSQGRGGLGG
jgi:formate-dependent nitrite reductase membrane component NrfD